MKLMYAEEVRMSFVRILVVDDFEHWHNFVRVCLEKRADVEISGVASSGLEAIQKAENLQPDLILLDISLPQMNGIQAAEWIRQVAPKSKILFFTGLSDHEIVRAAFRAGGDGYVLKSDALEDLMVGMEAVLYGKRYMSRSIAENWDS